MPSAPNLGKKGCSRSYGEHTAPHVRSAECTGQCRPAWAVVAWPCCAVAWCVPCLCCAAVCSGVVVRCDVLRCSAVQSSTSCDEVRVVPLVLLLLCACGAVRCRAVSCGAVRCPCGAGAAVCACVVPAVHLPHHRLLLRWLAAHAARAPRSPGFERLIRLGLRSPRPAGSRIAPLHWWRLDLSIHVLSRETPPAEDGLLLCGNGGGLQLLRWRLDVGGAGGRRWERVGGSKGRGGCTDERRHATR